MITLALLSNGVAMTPAITALEKASVAYKLHEYHHDPTTTNYGHEAAEKLSLEAAQVFKTLVIKLETDELAVAVIPVSLTLNLKSSAKSLGAKKAQMADPQSVERTTGYVLGGVSPIGQKKHLKTLIDESAAQFESIFVSGGRRGLEIEIDPADLCTITKGCYAPVGISKK
jgi:Cys-tRNA(Pro)/Cys-tRNA(Cys) deacylase